MEEKYLELRKKFVNRKNNRYSCSPTLKTDQNLAYTLHCLKEEEVSHKMCWISHETLPIWLLICCPLKKIVYASWKVLINAWEPRNDDWFCPTLSAVVKIFDHWSDVLICVLINTSAPSHWLKSVEWPVGPVL